MKKVILLTLIVLYAFGNEVVLANYPAPKNAIERYGCCNFVAFIRFLSALSLANEKISGQLTAYYSQTGKRKKVKEEGVIQNFVQHLPLLLLISSLVMYPHFSFRKIVY